MKFSKKNFSNNNYFRFMFKLNVRIMYVGYEYLLNIEYE